MIGTLLARVLTVGADWPKLAFRQAPDPN